MASGELRRPPGDWVERNLCLIVRALVLENVKFSIPVPP